MRKLRLVLCLPLAASLARAQGPTPDGGSLGQTVESEARKAESAVTREGGAQEQATSQPSSELQRALGMLHGNATVSEEAAKLAASNASSPKVKQLASKLGIGQSSIDKELLGLAAARGLGLGGGAADTQKASGLSALGALSKLKGASFDKPFMSWLVGHQQQSLDQAKQAQAQAKQSGDTGLTALLGSVVPKLESHLHGAKQVQASVDGDRQARAPAQSSR